MRSAPTTSSCRPRRSSPARRRTRTTSTPSIALLPELLVVVVVAEAARDRARLVGVDHDLGRRVDPFVAVDEVELVRAGAQLEIFQLAVPAQLAVDEDLARRL